MEEDLSGFSKNQKLKQEDYYLSPEGYKIFTKLYHLKRGYCCQSNCINCPYGYKKAKK